jgi:hypothetical protein
MVDYMPPPDDLAREKAREQYQLLTFEQLLDCGLSRSAVKRRVRSGKLELVGRGLYSLGPALQSFRQKVLAACLSVHGGAVACRGTAAVLYGIPGIRSPEIEVLTDGGHHIRSVPFVLHRTNYLPDYDVTVLHGIPITTPARTVFDIASAHGPAVAQKAADHLLLRKRLTVARLVDQGQRICQPGRGGSAAFRKIDERYGSPDRHEESELEREMVRVVHGHGFPELSLQLPVWDDGLHLGRIDAAYPDLTLGLEALGFDFHSAFDDWLKDCRRQNALVSRGWRILLFTTEDADRPRGFLADLARLLEEPWAARALSI